MKNQTVASVSKKLATPFYSDRKARTLKWLNHFLTAQFFFYIFLGSAFPQTSSYEKEFYNTPEVILNTSDSTSPLIYFEQPKKVDSDQAELKKNCVYGIVGHAIVWGSYSFNYERVILYSQNSIFKYFNIRIGGGHVEAFESSGPFYVGSINFLSGKKSNHVELDIGVFTLEDEGTYPAALVGYRYQKPGGHLLLRTGLGFPEGAYLSLGLAF